jgi:predicted SprT family Zn-dependent metalloprotease
VRMLVPPIVRRREIDRQLAAYFQTHRPSMFRRAISDFCSFYGVKRPRIQWFEYIDWGRTAGKTFEDGRIHLVHPENWKRCRVYNSERMWVQTVYHELAHYVFWTDAERKAEAFTLRMVRGLKRSIRRTCPASRKQSSPQRKDLRRRRPPQIGTRRHLPSSRCDRHTRRIVVRRGKRCAEL